LKAATPRPLLLGHRGVRSTRRLASRHWKIPAENTLAAFDYALDHGCDGFEFDLRYTRDRRCVICHDPKFDRKELAASDYSALEGLPCLEDLLARFAATAYLDLELKVAGNEEIVINALRAHPPQRGYVISSFLPEVVLRLHAIDPSLPLGYICDRTEEAQRWTGLPINAFIPHHSLVSRRLIDDVHARGLKLLTWTVNQKRDLLRLAAWGVDGLICDDPTLLSATFE
jgi:glycerophosphoryl diester phosphodiesterase